MASRIILKQLLWHRARASPIQSWTKIVNQFFMYAWPCSIKWRVQFQFSCKIFVAFSASSFCLSFGNVKITLNNPNATSSLWLFAEQRCSLKRECFYFVYLHFYWAFLTLFAYIIFIIINRRSEFSVDNFKNQVECFRSTNLQLIVAF